MSNELEKKIQSMLIGIMSDGFNRSVGALENSGALDTKKMKSDYSGIGSKYYDIVTNELERTARHAAPEVIKAVAKEIQGQ